MVTVRYWAGLKEAAGTSQDEVEASTLADALAVVCARHGERFGAVLAVCGLLVDGDPVGGRDRATLPLRQNSLVDCLPPFAGG